MRYDTALSLAAAPFCANDKYSAFYDKRFGAALAMLNAI